LQRSVVGAVLSAGLCAIVFGAAVSPAQAEWPDRPITLVVPYPAGGTADLLCRYAAQKASAGLGQQMVVENRPGGAGGRIAIEQVLRSAPNGYTLLCGTQLNYSITHLVFSKASFDPRPLEPISVLATYPLVVLLRQNFPANTLKEFIDYAKANSGKINYGNQGVANTGHLLGELMMLKAGFKMIAVPYRGSAPAIKDLLAGTIDMVPDYLLANKGNIDAGKLKFIAVASHERLKEYPNVPTVAEKLPGVVSITWMAVSAPPKTPAAITKRISDTVGKGFKEADMQEKIRKLLADPLGGTPEQMRDMIKQSLDTWEPVIKAARITVD
jgi:tripartite-type tricarboxylate transporter receptor subunit TctC